MNPKLGLFLISEGILASLLGQLVYYYALKEGAASRMVPVASAFPIVTFVGAIFLFGEKLTWQKSLGLGFTTLGIVFLKGD